LQVVQLQEQMVVLAAVAQAQSALIQQAMMVLLVVTATLQAFLELQ
jgi:hypothetical protein